MSLIKGCGVHAHHNHSVYDEIITHFPYAIFSIAVGMILLSLLSFFVASTGNVIWETSGDMLFHSFHFLHIVFAATGAMITFSRFSKRVFLGLVISAISAVFFCVLSDILMPYLSGELLGVRMHFHFCFHTELANVLPFLFVGLFNGYLMSRHCEEKQTLYSLGSHFSHIFVSSMASLFYMVANGLYDWSIYMGSIFLLLIVAVLLPCTLSDLVFPLWCARIGGRGEK